MTAVELDPKHIDIPAFLGRFKPKDKVVKIPWDGTMPERLSELRSRIDTLQELADAEPKKADEDVNEAVGDTAPGTAQAIAQLPKLIREYNDLGEKFKTEHTAFTLRPPEAADHIKARAAAKEDGVDLEAEGSLEAFFPYLWAEICVAVSQGDGSPVEEKMTGKAFAALRSHLGDAAMVPIQEAYHALNQVGDVSAPFSPLPLPSRTATKRSRS